MQTNLIATIIFIDFSKEFESIHRVKMTEILNVYGIPDQITSAIMIAYTNTKSIARTDDGDTEFINISGGVLQGDTLAPFLFSLICLDYVMKKALDRHNDIGFTLIERRSKRYPAIQITDVDYTDDLAIVTDKTKEEIKLNMLQKKLGCL